MPATLADPEEAAPGEQENLEADLQQAAPSSSAPPSQPQASNAPPPTWQQISGDDAFKTLGKNQQQEVFSKWVSDSSKFVSSDADTPKEQLDAYHSYVINQGRNLGMGFVINDDGKPEVASNQGDQIFNKAEDPNSYRNGSQGSSLMQDKGIWNYAANAPISFMKGAYDATLGSAEKLAGAGADYFSAGQTGDLADAARTLSKDVSIQAAKANALIAPTQNSVGNFLTQTIPSALGNLTAMLATGGATKGAMALRMGGMAAAEAAGDAYYDAQERGATPNQALAASGVAGGINGLIVALFPGIAEGVTKKVMGANADAFMRGAYVPTVTEAAKLLAADTATQATVGGVSKVAENAFDQQDFDPNRSLFEGVPQAMAQQGAFGAMHFPTLYRSMVTSGALRDIQNLHAAANDLQTALASGDTTAAKAASDRVTALQQTASDSISNAVDKAPAPTAGEVSEAQQIAGYKEVTPEPINAVPTKAQQAPITEALDGIIGEAKEATGATDLPTVPAPDTVVGIHPVFGAGEYKPEDLVGNMTETPLSPTTSQLSWNGLATDQVKRIINGEGEVEFGPVKPDETQSPTFQQPTLTKDTLGRSEAPFQPADLAAAQVVGSATAKETAHANEQSQSQPVLDEAQLGQRTAGQVGISGDSRPSEPVDAGEAHPAQEADAQHGGEVSTSPAHDAHASGDVTEGGGGKTPAPPPKTYDEYQKEIDDFMDKQEQSGMSKEQIIKQFNPNEGTKKSDLPPGYEPMPKELADLYDARDAQYKKDAEGQRDALHQEITPIVGDKISNKILSSLGLDDEKNGGTQAYFQGKIKDRLKDLTSSLSEIYNEIVHGRTNDDVGTGRFFWSGTADNPTITFEGKGRIRSQDAVDAIKSVNVIRGKVGLKRIRESLFSKEGEIYDKDQTRQIESKTESEPSETSGNAVQVESGSKSVPRQEVGTIGGLKLHAEDGVTRDPALEKRIGQAVKKAGVKNVAVVLSTSHDAPMWADDSQAGKIFVNPDKLAEALGPMTPKARGAYIDRLITEEVAHDAQGAVENEWRKEGTHEERINAIHDEMTPEERQQTLDDYGSDKIDPSKGTSPEDIQNRKTLLVRERARQLLQRKMAGETTEDTWLKGNRPELVRYLQALWEQLKARISSVGDNSELGKYLKATEDLLNEAKSAEHVESEGLLTAGAMPPSIKALGQQTRDLYDSAKEQVAKINQELKYGRDVTPLRDAINERAAALQRNWQTTKAAMDEINREVPDKLTQQAMVRWREAGGDDAKLQQDVNNAKDPELKKIYERAMNLSPKEKAIDQKIQTILKLKREQAVKLGVEIAEVENYASHMVVSKDGEPLNNSSSPGGGKSLKTAVDFAKQRTFGTMSEGEQAGYRYGQDDAASNLGKYLSQVNTVIANRQFVASLSKGKMPDGKPIIGPKIGGWLPIDKGAEQGKAHLVFDAHNKDATADYKSMDMPAFKNWLFKGTVEGVPIMSKEDMAIHPDAHSWLSNVFGKSAFRKMWEEPAHSVLGQYGQKAAKFLLDDLNSVAKSNLFALSPVFHPVQIGTEAAGHGVSPLAESSVGSMAKAIARGENPLSDIKPPDTRNPEVYDSMKHSLELVPKNTSALFEGHSDLDKTFLRLAEKVLPGKAGEAATRLKQLNQDAQNWIFHSYIPAIKYKSYETFLARNMDRFSKDLAAGKITTDQVKYLTAEQVNNAYGHLNYDDLNRNPTVQHMLQIGLLAPDFFEARWKHLKQAVKGVAFQSGREQFKVFATLGIAQVVGAQALNLMINGETDMSHPFDVRYHNRYYGIRTSVGDALNLFKDMYGIEQSLVRGTPSRGIPYVSARISPVARAIVEFGTGKNYRGEPVAASEIIGDFLAGNAPMVLQPLLRGMTSSTANNPVSPLEQAVSAMGLKVSRYSPITQTHQLASEWINQHGGDYGIKPVQSSHEASQYTPLKYALDDGDYKTAFAEYQKLVAGDKGDASKVISGVQKSINSPFIRGNAAQAAFYASLDQHDKNTYDAAQERKTILQQRLGVMLNQNQK